MPPRQDAASRALITQVLDTWPKRADGELDLTQSPMRLRAIAHRADTNEGQFVFNVLDASGNPLDLHITLAYDVPARSQAAGRWQALAALKPGTAAFNTALQALTDGFTGSQGRVQGSTRDPLAAGASASKPASHEVGSQLLADVQPPYVSLIAPGAGSFLRGTVFVTATATDDVKVSRVDFYDGTALIGSDSQAPFGVSWNTAAVSGLRSLTAQAFDTAGNATTSSAVSVRVDNSVSVLVLGSPRYTPQTLYYVRGFINVSWTVTDQSNSGVALVELLQDGAVVATAAGIGDTTYSFQWDTTVLANRNYTLTLRATDRAGNVQTSTRNLDVDNSPPTSALTSPADGSQVSGVVTLAANASDSQALLYVAFEIDGVVQTPFSTTAPFTRQWDTTGKSGTHTIVTIASDRAGNTFRSPPVTVTVP
ncbi:Ig-like domain-containing protein [Pyxidicoccus sp. 3LFB2]